MGRQTRERAWLFPSCEFFTPGKNGSSRFSFFPPTSCVSVMDGADFQSLLGLRSKVFSQMPAILSAWLIKEWELNEAFM